MSKSKIILHGSVLLSNTKCFNLCLAKGQKMLSSQMRHFSLDPSTGEPYAWPFLDRLRASIFKNYHQKYHISLVLPCKAAEISNRETAV